MWGDVESESGINDLATNVFSISFSFDAFLFFRSEKCMLFPTANEINFLFC